MQHIQPYKNANEAIKSLDNGGRFYSKEILASDGIIHRPELEKAGGVSNNEQQMILFFQMLTSQLEPAERTSVFSKLDKELMRIYEQYKPQELKLQEANFEGKLASNAILTGFPKLVDASSSFEGFIMFPVMLGNFPTFKKTPITEEYDVYELKDEESSSSFLIAHPIKTDKLPNKRMTLGGVVKELNTDAAKGQVPRKFLEVIYRFDMD